MKIHDEMSQISVPEDLDEKTYQSILSAEKTVQKNRFRKKCTWSVLSCLVIIFGIIHVANPAMAENIPIIGSVFSYIQDVIDFKGDYKKYATGTDERVQDHGITISMTEAYCDGANLFISYVIESQKKFTEYSDNQIFQNQIGYEGITKIKSDDKIYSLNDCGAAGVTITSSMEYPSFHSFTSYMVTSSLLTCIGIENFHCPHMDIFWFFIFSEISVTL